MSQKSFDDKSTLVQVMAWCLEEKVITWANVDPYPCRNKASLDHIENVYVVLYYIVLWYHHSSWQINVSRRPYF